LFSPLPRGRVLARGARGGRPGAGAGGAPRLFPPARPPRAAPPPASLPRPAGHHRDWIDACKGGRPASSNVEYGARLTEIVLLGVLAVRLRRPFAWHGDTLAVQPASAEAGEMIAGTYRAGWELT
jgi:hypothetical protein